MTKEDMIEKFRRGEAVADIAEAAGVTPQRVYQVLRQGGVTRADMAMIAEKRRLLLQEANRNRVERVYERVGTVSGTVRELKGEMPEVTIKRILKGKQRIVISSPAQRTWSDSDLLEMVRQANAQGITTAAGYARWRTEQLPSSSLIILRFGGWPEARYRAGVSDAGSKIRSDRQHTKDTVMRAVRRFVIASDNAGVYPSSRTYSKWASAMSEDLPSFSTIRIRVPEKTWSELVTAVRREIKE